QGHEGHPGLEQRKDAEEYGDHAAQDKRPPVSGEQLEREHRPPSFTGMFECLSILGSRTPAAPKYHVPYAPAIKVHAGKLVFVAGVTAAPVYHSHPHVAAEFDGIPDDPAAQAGLALDN